jgi:hypothetical protein
VNAKETTVTLRPETETFEVRRGKDTDEQLAVLEQHRVVSALGRPE